MKALRVACFDKNGEITRYMLQDGDTIFYCNEGIISLQLRKQRFKQPRLVITQKPKKGVKHE